MPETQPQQPKIEQITPPEGVFSAYSNHAGIGASQSELRIFFGELAEVNPERVRVIQRVHVLIPWLQAKALARLLQDYVDAFEKLNGSIMPPNLPPNVIATNPFPKK